MDTTQMPAESTVRRALRRLCTDSVSEAWLVKNHCRVLTELHVVRARTRGSGSPGHEELRDALVSYLGDAIRQLEQEQHQNLLRIAMALDAPYRGMTAAERYKVAGQKFRGEGAPPVKAGTIRQHHLDKAVEALTPIVMRDERAQRDGASNAP